MTNYVNTSILTTTRNPSDFDAFEVAVSPNPFGKNLRINGLEPGLLVTVYDHRGVRVLQRKATAEEMILDFNNEPSGFYTLMVEDKIRGIRSRRKLVKIGN